MFKAGKFIQEVYDRDSKLLGVFVSKDLWEEVHRAILPVLEDHLAQEDRLDQPVQEPLQDWEVLKKYWDFKYPVDMDVHCSLCGSETENWQEDSPRKFLLKAASLGGLVSFECCMCGARVTKKHFKDHINVTVQPNSTRR